MIQKVSEINNKIVLHYINEEKYKSNIIAVFLTVPLLRETVTINTLIPAVLKRGTSKYPSMQKLEIHLEEMYGSTLSASVDKTGNNHILKFYTETIKDEIVGENLFEKSVQNISELMFSPYLENGIFSNEYVNQEKEILHTVINNKVNNKSSYARGRCIESLCGDDGYGMYTYGYVQDLKNINAASIYNQYIDVLKTAKIDIFVCSNKSEEEVKDTLEKYFNYDILSQRENIYIPKQTYIPSVEKTKEIKESLDVVQGNLLFGLTITNIEKLDKNAIIVLNALLGVGTNSKLFINVREKEHLAYDASSSYIRNTNIISAYAGIEIKNYDKAVEFIKKEILDLKKGNISKRELADAKSIITYSYNSLSDSPYRVINFYFDKSISNDNISIDECIKLINKVKVSDIVNAAKKLNLNVIYYLTNEQNGGAV